MGLISKLVKSVFRKSKVLLKKEKDLIGKSPEVLKQYSQFLLNNVEEHRNSDSQIYMPEETEELKDRWKRYKPEKFYEKMWLVSSPATYVLWKLPEDTHKKLNEILEYATVVSSRYPVAGIGTGIITGVSSILYGLKKKGPESGKHVSSGLVKILSSTEKDPKTKKLGLKTRKFLEDYIINFAPKTA